MRLAIIRLAVAGSMAVCAAAQPPAAGMRPGAADLLIRHARVYTVNAAQPWAEAVAVRGTRIVFVGSDRDAASFRGPRTQVIDAGGRLLLPGITDSHVHFMSGALGLERVILNDARDLTEIQDRIRAFARAHPKDAWVLGRGWSYPQFGHEGLPHRRELDAAVSDRPALMTGFDGHTYWANSRALELAGITRETPDPPNGVIVRDAEGEPTGALKEAAGRLVTAIVPQPLRAQRLAALRKAIKEANRLGVTRVHSNGGDFDFLDLYDELGRSGDLTLRFNIAYFLDPPALTPEALGRMEAARMRFPPASDWLSVGAVKLMLDGVIESHTAALLQPYADDPSRRGALFWDPPAYTEAVAELDRRGWQIFTHAIGDRAVRLALDAYRDAAAADRSTVRDPRHRIEHIETIDPADVPRFGQEHVIASFQPLHASPDEDTLRIWLRKIGPAREPHSWPWQSIARAGGRLAFGSDWSVVTLNPWPGLENAVTRETPQGEPAGGWLPEERLTLEQAIHGYTLGAAIGGRREHAEGSIETGKLADMILLDRDLFRIPPHRIGATKVVLTVIGGRVVYSALPARPAAPRKVPAPAARP
jgi:predicted amidohydrolase YtcJ